MNITYREPMSLKELEALFRLRQTVYSEDTYLHKMVSSHSTCDINQYDLNALHYGAFEKEKPVAYIRITTAGETHFTNWVKQILLIHGIRTETDSSSYPFQSYYPDLIWSKKFIESLQGRKVGEVGKLAIDKNYRQAGTILSGFIGSFIQYCKKEQNITTGFGSCTLKLARYYRKFGFTLAQGAKPFIYAGLPEAVIVRFDS
jgi:hypothetical protein